MIPRTLSRIGLLLLTVAAVFVKLAPQLALWLVDAGDRLTAVALQLACR